MLAQQTVKGFPVADLQLSGGDTGVVDTEQRIDVVHGLRADVRELLDLGSCVLDLRGSA